MSFFCFVSDILSDKVNVAMCNVGRCADALALDVTINHILQESCMKSNESVIQIEDDLHAIAAIQIFQMPFFIAA